MISEMSLKPVGRLAPHTLDIILSLQRVVVLLAHSHPLQLLLLIPQCPGGSTAEVLNVWVQVQLSPLDGQEARVVVVVRDREVLMEALLLPVEMPQGTLYVCHEVVQN